MEPSRLNIEGLQPVDVSQTDETLSGNMDDNQDANKEMEPRVSMQGTFNLYGRSIAGGGLPVPAIIVQDEGTVVVNITVNPAGQVVATSINQRTNTVNPELRKAAEEAAKKTCFNEIDDIDNQTGTITYHFKLR
jgi:TonB family protein